MLNWYDLEERATLAQSEVSLAGETAQQLIAMGLAEENEPGSIRRVLATAFVNLGLRLNPSVLDPEAEEVA